MADETGPVKDFKSLGHRTLAQMAEEVKKGDASRIRVEASGHGSILNLPVHDAEIVDEAPARDNRPPAGKRVKTLSASTRGKIFVFVPTGDHVTVTKELVGKTYNGDPIHEVTSRQGRIFLASSKQLKEFV